MSTTRERVSAEFKRIQNDICHALEQCDGQAKFHEDRFTDRGEALTRVIRDGKVFEKGGVNFSASSGTLPPAILDQLNVKGSEYFACGVSIVIHPQNPWVPIIHMNIRYFETELGESWFGGGIDLTPHYVDQADAKYFHKALKSTCDGWKPEAYPDFKNQADEYFFIPHRNETRGIGGIFFDHLKPETDGSFDELLKFVVSVGDTFAPTYVQLVNGKKDLEYSEANKQWQLLRRGRYVEFNLVYDRGTKFGLQTGWRTESMLMSLPKMASWEYNFIPKAESLESETLAQLKGGIDWVNS
jgi:coproporphyrinogen III oxidase